jgi:hypothetical protein
MAAILNAAAADPAPQTGIKNVVLVHGAFVHGFDFGLTRSDPKDLGQLLRYGYSHNRISL